MAKLVLIDRDGVINEEMKSGYVESPEQLQIYPQALEAFALFKKHGFTCVVVTNQSVVGRGIITRAKLDEIHQYLRDTILRHGGNIAEIIVCTDHPDNSTNRRKPAPGMLLEALRKYDATPSETPMIGDAITDMQAAHSAGCRRYLVMTGKGETTLAALSENLYPVIRCADILDAARNIVAGLD